MSEPDDDDELDLLGDDEPFTCWCGVTGNYDEMCDDSVFSDGCGGTGHMECYCGGDFCVCHNHGEIECPGCDDCEPDDDDCDDDDGDWED